jgi:hypothetical protein
MSRIFCGLTMVLIPLAGFCQSFQNLDFEMAMITNLGLPSSVPITNALPHWQGFSGSSILDEVYYWFAPLDLAVPGVTHDSALFGDYCGVLAAASTFSGSAELAQTGLVPAYARSIHFYTSRQPFLASPNSPLAPEDYDFAFKLNGQRVPVSPIAVDSTAVLWAGDVSQVAGTVAEIRWSLLVPSRQYPLLPVGVSVSLDDISFSPESVINLIARPLQDQSSFIGASVHFDVATIDQGPYSYQWLFNGTPLNGQTNNTLDLDDVQRNQAGNYAVTVIKSSVSVTSPSANLVIDTIATWDFALPPPPGLSNVVAISAGAYHGVALKTDGTVVAWGENFHGQTNVPANLSNVVAIAAGYDQTLALKSNGTVIAWGWEQDALIPADLKNVVALAAGATVNLALKSDGTVVGWTVDFSSNNSAMPPTNLTDVVAIAAGASHGAALKADGTVAVWGNNGYGQLNMPTGLSNVVKVACGASHTLVLKSDGTTIAWGANNSGQTNVPAGLTNVVAISAGNYNSLALLSNGEVLCWGAQKNAPLGLKNVIAVSAGSSPNYSLALIGTNPPVVRVPLAHPLRTISGFSVTVSSSKARVYQLQYKDSLADSVWKYMPLVSGKGGALTLTDASINENQRFYQVRQW